MNKFSIVILAVSLFVACQTKHSKDYLTLAGKLENNTDSLITIANKGGIVKTIVINSDGSFKDTLHVDNAEVYIFSTNRAKRALVFLDNGFNIYLEGDAEKFMGSFKYSGEGAENSAFLLKQIQFGENIGNPQEIFMLDKVAFDKKIALLKTESENLLSSYSSIDSTLKVQVVTQNKKMLDYFNTNYQTQHVASQAYLKIAKGKPSPKFVDYEDFRGGKKSLDSFKGKYVYIDIWATWCRPCVAEIPSLERLEKKYHGKNIEFVSVSTDGARRNGGSWEKANAKWKNFVKQKGMTGIQLWSGEDYSFQQAYQINSIPRFILIDPNGNIVDASASRPSDPKLVALFKELGI